MSEVEKLLKSIEGLSPIEQAEYLMANYPKLVRAYGSAASDVARQFYQETRNEYFGEEGGEESFVARPAMAIPEAWAVEDIQKSARGGYARLPGIAVRRVMERADDTFRLNIRRDPKKARWAVVPHPGACGWCVLIAGNGWRYSRESADAQRHDNCKCSIAADFDTDNPALDGYDPKWMQQAYAKCEETVHDSVDQLWNELSPEKKAKYLKKGGRGKDGFKRDLVVAEMNRRDREWLRTGKAPEIDYGFWTSKERHALEDHERKQHRFLSTQGFSFVPIPTDRNAPASIDLWMNGNLWELKSVSGGLLRVKQRVDDAVSKWERLHAKGLALQSTPKVIVDNRDGKASTKEVIATVEEKMKEHAAAGFNEAYVIDHDGRILRVVRQ